MDGDTGEDAIPIPGRVGLQGVPGPTGATGPPGFATMVPGQDGDQGEEAIPIQGRIGPTGAQGLQGLPGLFVIGQDGDTGEDAIPIPGRIGPTGSQGPSGVVGMPGDDGDDGMEGIPGGNNLMLLPVGVLANSAGATLTGPYLNLQPASPLFPGVVSVGTAGSGSFQVFAGDKLVSGVLGSARCFSASFNFTSVSDFANNSPGGFLAYDVSGGQGDTSLVAGRDDPSPATGAGFMFYDYNRSGATLSQIAQLDGLGNLTVASTTVPLATGYFQWINTFGTQVRLLSWDSTNEGPKFTNSTSGRGLSFNQLGLTASRVATWQDKSGTVAYLSDTQFIPYRGVGIPLGGMDWDGEGETGVPPGASGTLLTPVGTVPNANAASFSAGNLTLQPADASNPGVVNATSQVFAGVKAFSSGVVVGANGTLLSSTGISPASQIQGTTQAGASSLHAMYANDASGIHQQFLRSRGTTVGALAPNISGDILTNWITYGVNSSNAVAQGGVIRIVVDGTPIGAVPTRIEFMTSTPTTGAAVALTLDNARNATFAGNVGIGAAPTANALEVGNVARFASVTSPTAATTGKGVEVYYYGSFDVGVIASYDRSASAYKPLQFNALTINIAPSNTVALSITSTTVTSTVQVKGLNYGSDLVSKGVITTAVTIDWTAGNIQTFTETTLQNPTLTFTAPAAPCPLWLKIVAPAAGTTGTITYPGTVKGSPPATVTLAKTSMLEFFWDGTNYFYMAGCLNV
jgi:hypothetical protein